MIPLLLWVERRRVPPGRVAALFVFLYAALRIPVDLLREYPLTLAGLRSGQAVNIAMAAAGAVLLAKSWLCPPAPHPAHALPASPASPSSWHRLALVLLLVVPLVIPSDATRDVPAAYSRRHPGLEHSRLYPSLDAHNRAAR